MRNRQFHLSCLIKELDVGKILGDLQELNAEVLDCRLVVEDVIEPKPKPAKPKRHPGHAAGLAKRMVNRQLGIVSCFEFLCGHLSNLPVGIPSSRQELIRVCISGGYTAMNANTAVQDAYRQGYLDRLGPGKYITKRPAQETHTGKEPGHGA